MTPNQIQKRIDELTAEYEAADAAYEKLNREVAQLLFEGKVEDAESHDAQLGRIRRRLDGTAEAVKIAKRELAAAVERERSAAAAEQEKAAAAQEKVVAEHKAAVVDALATLEASYQALEEADIELSRFGGRRSVRHTQLVRSLWEQAPSFAKGARLSGPVLGGSGRTARGLEG